MTSRPDSSSRGHPEAESVEARAARERDVLLEVTQIPTAAGREERVEAYIRAYVEARPALRLRADRAGNLVVEPRTPWGASSTGSGGTSRSMGAGSRVARSPLNAATGVASSSRPAAALSSKAPIFITAHLDHPAFVVERIVGPATVELSFRGGVNDDYFPDARIVLHPQDHAPIGATLSGPSSSPAGANPFGTMYLAELDSQAVSSSRAGEDHSGEEQGGKGALIDDAHTDDHPAQLVRVGDIATWALPPAEVDRAGIVHTPACDDLAAVAAALCAYDRLLELALAGERVEDVRLLFTRAEEIGFIGAIAACRLGTIPSGSRLVALENSRASNEAPIGGGPIVRVGDRLSVFDPRLTAACARRAEQITSAPASITATQKQADLTNKSRWQRKLMAGGACEATVFCAYGFQATCLCLPLGNYHNMSELDRVQGGTWDAKTLGPPRIAREFIALSDYLGLVDLLTAIGRELPTADPIMPRLDKLFENKAGVLGAGLDASKLSPRRPGAVTGKRDRAKPPRAGAPGGGGGKPSTRATTGRSDRPARGTKTPPRPRRGKRGGGPPTGLGGSTPRKPRRPRKQ